MGRYKYLDAARGIGMMLVVIGHSVGLSKYLIYYFIQLFFILSGYLYKPGRSYGENIAKKAKRLLVPYFVYSTVLLAFYVLMGRTLEETKFSAIGILYSRFCLYDVTTTPDDANIFFFNIANGGTWYLTAFFVTGLVFHLVIDKCLENRKFLIGTVVVLTVITMALAELPILLPWSIDIAFVGTVFMIVGALLKKAEFFEKKWNIWLILGTFACYMILVAINPELNTSAREYGIYGRWSVPLYIIIGITGSILCIWVAKLVQDTFVGTFLVYIGQNTIILLSFHILGLAVFEMIAGRFLDIGSLTGMAYWGYHIVRISASVCGCLILGKLIDIIKKKTA